MSKQAATRRYNIEIDPATGLGHEVRDDTTPPQSEQRDLDLGDALRAVKSGRWVARAGWAPGNNQYLYIVAETTQDGANQTVVRLASYVAQKLADGSVVPWAPNQADLLAEDYQVIAVPAPHTPGNP